MDNNKIVYHHNNEKNRKDYNNYLVINGNINKPSVLIIFDKPLKSDIENHKYLSIESSFNKVLNGILNKATNEKTSSYIVTSLYDLKDGISINYSNIDNIIKNNKSIEVIITLGYESYNYIRNINLNVREYYSKSGIFYKSRYKNIYVVGLASPATVKSSKKIVYNYWYYYYLAFKFAFNTDYIRDLHYNNIQKLEKNNYTFVYIDTLDKFKTMMSYFKSKVKNKNAVLSIDTETECLDRHDNKILTIQFATDEDKGYFIPIYHKNAKWDNDELKYILKKLKELIVDYNWKELVFFNSKFDLFQIYRDLNISYINTKTYCCMQAEYALNECVATVVKDLKAKGTLTLVNTAERYGIYDYDTIEFKKSDRATIKDLDITPDLIYYGILDVIVPIQIRKCQLRMAKIENMPKFKESMEILSVATKNFVEMERNGMHIDYKYLLHLLDKKTSPILKIINDILFDFKNMKSVKKASNIIFADTGSKNKSLNFTLFGDKIDTSDKFNINSNKHKLILFRDVLKLKAIKTKKGGYSTGKSFQETYSNIPEVKLLKNYTKVNKLFTSYVKSFYKTFKYNKDTIYDGNIRSDFSAIGTVTGRISAINPNLQQIPSHGDLAKYIKNLFIAPKGYAYVKLDYNAVEVRGLSIVSGDKALADAFNYGDNLKSQFIKKVKKFDKTVDKEVREKIYKLKLIKDENEIKQYKKSLKKYKKEIKLFEDLLALAKHIKVHGDLHRKNASIFFDMALEEVDDDIRQAVKQIVFGKIYGMSLQSMAKH